MTKRTMAYALYASLAAAVALAGACVLLARTAAVQRRRLEEYRTEESVGALVRNELFARLLARKGPKEGTAGRPMEIDGTPEELKQKLQCFLEMIDAADRCGSNEVLVFAIPLVSALIDEHEGLGPIPGGEEMVRKRLPVLRRALSSDEPTVRWVAALMLMRVGDRADLAAVGRAVADVPGGKVLSAVARAKAEAGDEEAAQARAMGDIMGLLSSESEADRMVALLFSSLIVKEGSEKTLYELLVSDDPADQAAALEALHEVTGEDIKIDPAELRSWIQEQARELRSGEQEKREAKEDPEPTLIIEDLLPRQ